MRGQRDVLLAELRIAAAHDADHVLGVDALDGARDREIGDDAGRHGAELARLRLLAQRRHVETRLLQQRGRRAVGDPPAHADRRRQLRIAREEPLPRRVRADEHLEGIARLVGPMHDENAGRAAPFRLLVLVRPPAVVRHRHAAEQRRLGGRRRRVVHEHEHDLALEIRALEIVPLVLGCDGAVADEHQLPARGGLRHGAAGGKNDVLTRPERRRRLAAHRCAGGAGLRRQDVDRHRLEIRAVHAGLDAVRAQLGGDVFRRDASAARAGRATLQQIGGEEAKMSIDLGCGDRRLALRGERCGEQQQPRGGAAEMRSQRHDSREAEGTARSSQRERRRRLDQAPTRRHH